MAVVGATVAVLPRRAPELRHGDDDDVGLQELRDLVETQASAVSR